jgi:2-oxo-4-hydroxy-4-carboxy-5-ureidoimidazoline decarboxylase
VTKIALAQLNETSEGDFARVLGPMVEHAPWVAEKAARRRPFGSLAELFAAMRHVVLEAGAETRLGLLQGHPELAGLAAKSGSMTAESSGEQGGAGLAELDAERARLFDALNAAYAARHGFPFIIAVRRHGLDSILSEFRRRVGELREAEIETALTEVFRIVALRLDATIEAPDRLPVTGRLSTHVLDIANGVPAEGMAISLYELVADNAPRPIATAVTNADGRTDAPLIADRPLPVATYELRFALGDYYRAAGMALPSPAFLDVVPIRFGLAEPEGDYHVPLTATPWSYATARDS